MSEVNRIASEQVSETALLVMDVQMRGRGPSPAPAPQQYLWCTSGSLGVRVAPGCRHATSD